MSQIDANTHKIFKLNLSKLTWSSINGGPPCWACVQSKTYFKTDVRLLSLRLLQRRRSLLSPASSLFCRFTTWNLGHLRIQVTEGLRAPLTKNLHNLRVVKRKPQRATNKLSPHKLYFFVSTQHRDFQFSSFFVDQILARSPSVLYLMFNFLLCVRRCAREGENFQYWRLVAIPMLHSVRREW
jgi:hypothetical protein